MQNPAGVNLGAIPGTGESLFDLYFRYAEATEPPIIYHRWALITSISAYLGRSFWFPFGAARIFPNMYVMLIGSPGTRKSTSIKMARRVISGAGYTTFAAERTTKEKFLLDLEGAPEEEFHSNGRSKGVNRTSDVLRDLKLVDSEDAHDGIPREIFVTADEFNEFAGTGNLDFLSTLGALWDWDDEGATYKQRFKNSKSISIFQPTITLLGGNTHSSFKLAFPEQAIGQGFLSRLILVHSEPSGRKITFPNKPPEELVAAIADRLAQIKLLVKGECQLTTGARTALDVIYRTWTEIDDYRLNSYSNRRFTHLIKLCLVVAAMRCSTILDTDDVTLANTILTYTESAMPKALGEFGKSKDSDAAHSMMQALYNAASGANPKPLSVDELWKVVSRDLDKRERMMDVIQGLVHSGKIAHVEAKKGHFFPINRPVAAKNAAYVELSRLKEMTGK